MGKTTESEWIKVKLGDYLIVLTDYHANGSYENLKANVELLKNPDFAIMIRTTNFEKADFQDDLRYITKKAYNFLQKSKVKPGDILMNKIANAGSVYYMPNLHYPVSLGMNLFLLRTKKEYINQRFIYYYLKVHEKYIKQFSTGTAAKTITKESVRKLDILLPPLSTQNAIVNIVSSYDDLIENNTRRIAILEEMAQAIYQEWFVYFRYPGHEENKMVESELGMIPEGWKIKTLEDLCSITMGQSPSSLFYNENEEGLPFHQGVSNFGEYFPINRIYCTVENRIAEPGDILFSVRAPVGRMNITLEKIVIGRGLSAIHSKTENQIFILYQLKDHFQEEDIIGNGAIFKSVTKNDMYNVKLFSPSLNIVLLFEEHIQPVFKNIELLTRKNNILNRTRDLLLPKLISGEIDVEALDIEIPDIPEPEEQQYIPTMTHPEPFEATQLALPL